MKKPGIFMVSVLTASVSMALTASVNAQEKNASADDVEKIEVVTQRQPYRGDVPLKSLPQKKSSKSKKVADDSFDDLMIESKDLFFDDNSDNSNYNSENSTDKIENYMTE